MTAHEKAAACPFGVVEGADKRIMWEITYRCNLGCKHCCTKAGKESEDELSLSQIIGVLDQFPENGLNGVYFTGGEPLMREDIFDILEAAAAKKMRVSLASNGTLITKDVAKRLASSGVSSVHVSLDDYRPSYHDAFVCKTGAFESTLHGIKNLMDAGVLVKVDHMVTRSNCTHVKGFMEFMNSLGVKYVIVSSVFGVGRAKGNNELFLDECQRAQVDSMMAQLKDRYDGVMEIYYARSAPRKPLPLTECPGGKHWFHLDGMGNMSPCSYVTKEDKSMTAGNVRTAKLSNILSSIKMQDFRKIVRERGKIRECVRCKLRGECGFGCPILSKMDKGSYNELDMLCRARNA